MPTSLPRLLRDLDRLVGKIETSLEERGSAILDAFLEHTPHRHGAVYLRDSRANELQLAARSDEIAAPQSLTCKVPDDVVDRQRDRAAFEALRTDVSISPAVERVIPLRGPREDYGLVALSACESGDVDDLDALGTASRYLSALLGHQRMADELREGDFQLKYRLWELQSLYDIGLSIASTLDLDKLADEILFRAVSLLNARRAALYLRSEGRFALHRAFGDVRSHFLEHELDAAQSARLLSDGTPIRFDVASDCIFPQCASFVAMPIQINGEVIGVLAVADRELREGGVGAFEENDLRVLSLFANQVAIALENARLHRETLEKHAMQRELEVAATIQKDILPRSLPVIPGFEIDAFSRPARQLGGDYHAFFVREGTLTLCVADVAGKSVPAAILVSALHAALQLLFDEGRDLGEIATELNRHIHHWSAENKFITLVVATIDPAAGVVRYVNAGHNPAYITSADRVEALASHGLPIGLLPQSLYKTQTAPFHAGSMLALYSDGITEAEDVNDDEFGSERLEALLRQHSGAPVREVRDAISSAVDAFASGVAQKDDQTIVLVRRTE